MPRPNKVKRPPAKLIVALVMTALAWMAPSLALADAAVVESPADSPALPVVIVVILIAIAAVLRIIRRGRK